MMELTIKGVAYQFNFGMGFMRDINKRMNAPVEGLPEVKQNIGLQYNIAGIIDNDVEVLVDLLDTANKAQNPRVTRPLLDDYIESEETDLDGLFQEVLFFLENANATKKTVERLRRAFEAKKAAEQ